MRTSTSTLEPAIWIMSLCAGLAWVGGLSCSPPQLEQEAHRDTTRQMVEVSNSNLSDREKFIKIMALALNDEGKAVGRPDVLFAKHPNWHSLLQPYFQKYSRYQWASIGLTDFSFIEPWYKAKKETEFSEFLIKSNYINEQGVPTKRIDPGDRDKIVAFATTLYDR